MIWKCCLLEIGKYFFPSEIIRCRIWLKQTIQVIHLAKMSWVFVAMLAFSSCSEWGLLSSCLVQASLVSAHRLQGMQGSVVEAHGLSSCISWALDYRLSSWDAWALLLCCIWHFPGSEIEPASPALVGGIFTTEPPGKPHFSPLTHSYFNIFIDLIF